MQGKLSNHKADPILVKGKKVKRRIGQEQYRDCNADLMKS